MGKRAEVLAGRVEAGAELLAQFAEGLSDAEWNARVRDGRTVGVVVHHVASMYPIEIEVARSIAGGKAVEGVTWEDVAGINSKHAVEHAKVGKAEALELLRKNSREAAAAVRRVHGRRTRYGRRVFAQLRCAHDDAVRGRGSCPAARVASPGPDPAGARALTPRAGAPQRGDHPSVPTSGPGRRGVIAARLAHLVVEIHCITRRSTLARSGRERRSGRHRCPHAGVASAGRSAAQSVLTQGGCRPLVDHWRGAPCHSRARLSGASLPSCWSRARSRQRHMKSGIVQPAARNCRNAFNGRRSRRAAAKRKSPRASAHPPSGKPPAGRPPRAASEGPSRQG